MEKDNFVDTIYRMDKDSDILLEQKSWMNSCYLSGYTAECYCKILINKAQNNVNKTHDLNKLNLNLADFMSGDIKLKKYLIDLPKVCPTVYNGAYTL